jgi:aspartate aminotransferase
MYDQMYWHLTYGAIKHYDPVSLNPEMKQYTVYIDAISKVFSATGVRVGWSMGPQHVLSKMKAILTHIGAWAPMAEQKAVARYLPMNESIDEFLDNFRHEIEIRLRTIYNEVMTLKKEGFAIDAIEPEGAIYLTIKVDLAGKSTDSGRVLKSQTDVTAYLLDEAKLAIVPFYAFGASKHSPWYRLSVGTCRKENISEMTTQLRTALKKIH